MPCQAHATINYGPVIHGSADAAQLAWNYSGTINQAQNYGGQITPGSSSWRRRPLARSYVILDRGIPA